MVWSELTESSRVCVWYNQEPFPLFTKPIQQHNPVLIECAWKTCLALHNMLIPYDGNDLSDWERNLDYAMIDPDLRDDEEEYEEIELEDYVPYE